MSLVGYVPVPLSSTLTKSLTLSSLGLMEVEVVVRDGIVSFLRGITLGLPYNTQALPGSIIGVKIANISESLGNVGTLGGYIKVTRNGKSEMFGLTNHHVVAGMLMSRNG